MQMLREDMVAMAEALGFAAAAKWSKQRMTEKLVEIAELAGGEGQKIEDDPKLDKLLQQVIEAKGVVEVVQKLDESEEDETDEKDEPEEDEEQEDEEEDEEEAEDKPEPDDEEDETVPVKKPKEKKVKKAKSEKAKAEKGKKSEKPKAEKVPGVKKEKGPGRPKAMGKYSAGPFVRWLGRKGVSLEGAKIVLDGEGLSHLKEQSIKMELREVREKCPPADVSKQDAKAIRDKYPKAFAKGK
jgi:outer membrane biosynthesis protein TonB